MTLVHWNPLHELDAMERRMRRALDDMGIVPAALPAADVYETPTAYVFELEVPGFDQKELTVEVIDHTLAIKGERRAVKEEKGKNYRLHERLADAFERRFHLPAEADATSLAADFANGVLVVRAPKATETKPQKVAIKAG